MDYITIKRFKRDGIDGHFNIPYGTKLEKRDGFLSFDDKIVAEIYDTKNPRENFAGVLNFEP